MDREKLYDKINKRVDIMINQGLIEETKKILELYKEYPTAMQAIGYKETKEYLVQNIRASLERIDEIRDGL